MDIMQNKPLESHNEDGLDDEVKIGENFIKKQIKIFDDLENDETNLITIDESSNMKLGTGTRIWECVLKT